MNALNPFVAFYSTKTQQWQEELEQLKIIAFDCGLTKALTRGVPCHTFQQINVVRFKSLAAQSKCPVVYYVNSSTNKYGFTPKSGAWTKIAIYWTNAGMKEWLTFINFVTTFPDHIGAREMNTERIATRYPLHL